MTQITADDWDLYQSLNRDPAVINFCFDEPSFKEIEENFNSRLPVWNKASEHWL
ncbi:GNAT family N-acetyltransferase, partial [Vibrio anguillarum]|nr:GNAT family N-acetyltransferase [Vibrio anguillarum]